MNAGKSEFLLFVVWLISFTQSTSTSKHHKKIRRNELARTVSHLMCVPLELGKGVSWLAFTCQSHITMQPTKNIYYKIKLDYSILLYGWTRLATYNTIISSAVAFDFINTSFSFLACLDFFSNWSTDNFPLPWDTEVVSKLPKAWYIQWRNLIETWASEFSRFLGYD